MRGVKRNLEPKRHAKHPQLSEEKFSPRAKNEKPLNAKEEKLALEGFLAIRRLAIDWDVKKAGKALNSLLRRGLNPETKFQEGFGKAVKDTARLEFFTTDTLFSIVAETLIPLAANSKRGHLIPALEAIGDSVFPKSLNFCRTRYRGTCTSLYEPVSDRKGSGGRYPHDRVWRGATEPSKSVRYSRNFDFDS